LDVPPLGRLERPDRFFYQFDPRRLHPFLHSFYDKISAWILKLSKPC
jgi:hypothetical protein